MRTACQPWVEGRRPWPPSSSTASTSASFQLFRTPRYRYSYPTLPTLPHISKWCCVDMECLCFTCCKQNNRVSKVGKEKNLSCFTIPITQILKRLLDDRCLFDIFTYLPLQICKYPVGTYSSYLSILE